MAGKKGSLWNGVTLEELLEAISRQQEAGNHQAGERRRIAPQKECLPERAMENQSVGKGRVRNIVAHSR